MEQTNIPLNFLRRLKALLQLIDRAYGAYKFQIVLMTVLGFVSGILEGVGVNALIPLVTFVLGQTGGAADDTITNFMRTIFALGKIPFVPKYLLTFIVVLFFGKAIVGTIIDCIRIRISADYERETRARLFRLLMHSSWSHLIKARLGQLETLTLVDVPAGKELLSRIGLSIMLITSLSMYLVVAFSISTFATLLTFAVGLGMMILFRPISIRIRKYSTIRSELQYEVTHFTGEHIGGLKTIKAAGLESQTIEKGIVLFESLRKYSVYIELLTVIAISLVPPLAVLYIAGIFALAFKSNLIAIAALPSIVYLIYRVFSYVQQLQSSIQVLDQQVPYLQNILRFEESAGERSEVTAGREPFVLHKHLELQRVSFAYEGTKEVLHNISFSVPRGGVVGIIGPSGAGKTTCVDLLLRLLQPTTGRIMLDHTDSARIDLRQWRSKISYVSQDFFLIQGTIRDNIALYDDSITEAEMWEAARLAHINQFIKESPLGLDSEVGERGIELSMGQRQRLVIARALARKPEVLILDEATSALDTESETHIQRMFAELKGKLTIIIIAHRLSTIMHADDLIVLVDGKVAETGSPQELLRNSGSYFYKVSTIVQ